MQTNSPKSDRIGLDVLVGCATLSGSLFNVEVKNRPWLGLRVDFR